ncbi:efflux RND transporter permease subunit [Sansalvadorimonas verongulae]|uniref:efflux RND transporter permease subunit n=1 Tax=Sansalvadorimonas verongulae TaxID=2172824 RepID=UPI0012BD5126|nr:efflux RND transporter permease subunit [Sansalvadorimonas verongulae]MTI13530.1 efflux RND transporter permease subunit [Sansalvadorimonas verongulae]
MQANEHKGVVAWFASNPVAANLLMMLILMAGVMTALNLNIEGWPGLKPKSVKISVDYDSGSAKSSEEGVTIKIEEALQTVQGIKKITSISNAGGSRITVDRESGYDLDTLYTDIKNKLDSISTLPLSAEKPVVSKKEHISNAISVSLYGDVGQDVLQKTARQLRDKLLANPDIDLVEQNGNLTPEITVQVDESRLQALGLTISDIGEKIADASTIVANGELFSRDGTMTIKADKQSYWLREFESIVIKETTSGQKLTLADVATVHDGFEQSTVLSRFNGQPAIGLDIQMRNKTGNIINVSEQAQKIVADFRAELPANMHMEAWNNQSQYAQNRLALLAKNGAMGIALVMIILALFLNARLALWVGLGLPVIFSGAMILMGPQFFNMTLNELTTFGLILVLGIVVDDAVVVGESVFSEQEKHGASLSSTIRGAQRVSLPTVFGVLTTAAAFISLTVVEGEMGEVFAYFAITATFCLIFSLIESKLILPAHLARKQKKLANPDQANPVAKVWGKIQGGIAKGLHSFTWNQYHSVVEAAIKLRYAVLMVMIALFMAVMGMMMSGKIKVAFFPDIPSDFIQMQLTLEDQAGYGLVQQQAVQVEEAGRALNKELMEQYNLTEAPIAHLHTLTKHHSVTISAELSPASNRPIGTNDIVSMWESRIGALEGVSKAKFLTSWELEPDIAVELRALNPQTLQAASKELMDALAQYQGVSTIQNSLKAGQAQVELSLKPAGRAMGLTVAMLAQQIQDAYLGYEVQRIQRGRDEIKVKVRYQDTKRQSLDNLNNARIRTSDGKVVLLGTVATLSTESVAAEVKRIDRQRVAVVTADVDKDVVSADQILKAMNDGLFKRLEANYRDLSIKVDGEAQQQQETSASMTVAFSAALFAIFALLAIPLKSYTQPLIIMMAIPFGVIGALLGHWLHGVEVSVLSVFGIMALAGVVVNNSLLLVTRYNELTGEGVETSKAIVEAACGRLRAVLITSLTTYIGLVPLIFETSVNAQFLIPAALAIGYGILFSSVITLILVPALLLIGSDISSLKQAFRNHLFPSKGVA